MILPLFISLICLLFVPLDTRSIINNTSSITVALNWADVTATRLVACYYHNLTGHWKREEPWQGGNTLESLANFLALQNSPVKYVFEHTFARTDIFAGGTCFDDMQWYLLAWIEIYEIDPKIKYLHRAELIFETVSKLAWDSIVCTGGLRWCPTRPYKNAITNELFLTSSMRLHPYASLLRKPLSYYLDWALKEWHWFEQTTMINNNYLINDGLNDDTCLNNNQTTWTYNQGVILSGLAMLANATNNATLLTIA
ncbi:unnamed protein product, partial [Adineta ricciae]